MLLVEQIFSNFFVARYVSSQLFPYFLLSFLIPFKKFKFLFITSLFTFYCTIRHHLSVLRLIYLMATITAGYKCDWICKKGLIRAIINIQKYHFVILYLKNALTSMCAFLHRSVVIQDHSVDGLFNGQLVEMPAIQIVYFTRQSIPQALLQECRVGVVGSHKKAGLSDSKNLYG